MSETVVVRAEDLRAFGSGILAAAGMPDEDAGLAADAMIWSDLRGAVTHGVCHRVPKAVSRIRAGATNPRPSWIVKNSSVGTALLDAEHGWGQVAGTRAMNLAVKKARDVGVGVVVVRDADVTASMGWYSSIAVRERMIGMTINNTPPLMAAWGGTRKVLGNQAFSVGCPAGRHQPIMFDSAVTQMSNNGIRAAERRGERLPLGVALDEDGQPTTDPMAALAGIMLPMGGHRGYGLALMWEVLTGVLAGGRMAPDVSGLTENDKPMGLSMFCLAVDPQIALSYQQFVDRVDQLIDHILSSPPAVGVDQIRIPGHRGAELSARYKSDGIPLPGDSVHELCELGAEYGLALGTLEGGLGAPAPG